MIARVECRQAPRKASCLACRVEPKGSIDITGGKNKDAKLGDLGVRSVRRFTTNEPLLTRAASMNRRTSKSNYLSVKPIPELSMGAFPPAGSAASLSSGRFRLRSDALCRAAGPATS